MTEQYQVMSNQIAESETGRVDIVPTTKERERLRALAAEYSEIAGSDVMRERKAGWKAVRDLAPIRPMILFETLTVAGFVRPDEFECENEYLRNVEHSFVESLKHYHLAGDDIVFENYFQLAWRTHKSDWGVRIVEHHADDSMAYMSNFPVKTPGDISKLKVRDFYADKDATFELAETLDGIFGKTLPVKTGNRDPLSRERGYYAFNGLYSSNLTMDLFKLIGNDNLLFWTYDHPEALHEIMHYLTGDRKRQLKWMLDEEILVPNTDGQFGGPFSYGYVSDLPEPGSKEKTVLKDCWIWADSQETAMISPEMFRDLFLPYIAEIANQFGLTYYGCCEPIEDRIEYVKKAIGNIRVFSVSAWNKDHEKLSQIIGRDHVYCYKPNPAFVSGKKPLWDYVEKEIAGVWKYIKNSNSEFVVRDLYDTCGDGERGRAWTQTAKRIIGLL